MADSSEDATTLQDDAMSLFEGMEFVSPTTLEPEAEEDSQGERANDELSAGKSADAAPAVEFSDAPRSASMEASLNTDEVASKSTPPEESSEEGSALGAKEVPTQAANAGMPKSYSSGSAVLSGPLDETMFSGLSVSTDDVAKDAGAPAGETLRLPSEPLQGSADGEVSDSAASDQADAKAAGLVAAESAALVLPAANEGLPRGISESSLDSRGGADDNLSSVSRESSTAGVPTKQASITSASEALTAGVGMRPQVIRKKKRTLRVGYARDADEGDEAGQSKLAMSASLSPSGALDLTALYETGKGPAGSSTLAVPGVGQNADTLSDAKAGVTPPEARGVGAGEGVSANKTKVAQSQPGENEQILPKDSNLDGTLKNVVSEPGTEAVSKAESQVETTEQDEKSGGEEGASPVDQDGTEAAKDAGTAGSPGEEAGGEDTEVSTKSVADVEPSEGGEKDEGLSEPQSDADRSLNPSILGELPLEARVEVIRKGVQAKIAALKAKAGALITARQLAVQKRRQASKRSLAAAGKVKELESKLAEACEREDFEAADALSQQMEEAEREAEAAGAEAREAEGECDLAGVRVQENEEAEMEVELVGARLLKAVQEEASSAAKKIQEEALAAAAAELEQLAGEEEEREARRRKVMLEERVVEEEAGELRKKVEESTRTERAQKDELVAERTKLEADLEELKRQVAAKEAEIAAQDEKIQAVDDKIGGVAAKFDKLRVNLEKEGERVGRLKAELEEEGKRIEEERKRVEESKREAEEEGRKLEGMAEAAGREAMELEKEAEGRKAMAAAAVALRDKMAQLAARERTVVEDAQAVRQHTTELRAALQELAASRAKLQQDKAAAQQRVAFAEKRGPELEAEKRLAAGSRNFKEAARLAAEAKLLANDKEAAAAHIASLNAELETVEKDEKLKAMEVAELENMVAESEKEVAMARCERLRLVAMAARKEMEAAAELEEFEEAETSNMEAEAADEEADALQKAHGLEGQQYERIEDQGLGLGLGGPDGEGRSGEGGLSGGEAGSGEVRDSSEDSDERGTQTKGSVDGQEHPLA